jgi:hypothetical protein
LIELESILASRLPTLLDRGFLPHMVYGDPWRTGGGVDRGPLRGMSAFTQPPVYVLALDQIVQRGFEPDPWLYQAASEALAWLWSNRLRDGLLTIVHPWESGADLSPRWDGWYERLEIDPDDNVYNVVVQLYDRLVKSTEYDNVGAAVSNPRFVVAPSAFNGIAADGARRLTHLTGEGGWGERYAAISTQLDDQLWDEKEQLWIDRPDLPHEARPTTGSIPTLDGALGALATTSRERAAAALSQCVGTGRFAAPYGPRYVPSDFVRYDPNLYWRGPAWPQLNFLLITAAQRHALDDVAAELIETTIRGVWSSQFSEYWNPETGEARGARPQSWAAVVAALTNP